MTETVSSKIGRSSQISYAPAANALTPIVTQYLGF